MIKQQNAFSRNKGAFRNSQTTQSHELIYDSFFDDCVNVTVDNNTRNNDKYVASLFNHVYINQCFPEKDIEDLVGVAVHRKETRKKVIEMYSRLKKKLKFDVRTLHLALMFFDKINAEKADAFHKVVFHIALGCLVLSMKFVYVQTMFPYLKCFETLCGNGYYFTMEEIKHYEVLCLKLLEYNLGISTAADFIMFYDMKKTLLVKNDNGNNDINININVFKQKVYMIILDVLHVVPYTQVKPHELAVFAITQAKEYFNIKNPISPLSEQIYNIKPERLEHICEVIKQILNNNNNTKVISPQTHRLCNLTMTLSDKNGTNCSSFGKTTQMKIHKTNPSPIYYARCSSRNNGNMLKSCSHNKSKELNTSSFCYYHHNNNSMSKMKSKRRKNGSLCDYINSKPSHQSFLDDYLQTNLKTYRKSTKDKTVSTKRKNSQSSDSNYKKDTDESSDGTPDNVKLNIPKSNKYKIKHIQNSIIANVYYPVVVRKTQQETKKKTSSVDNRTVSIQTIFQSIKKTTINNNNTSIKRGSVITHSIKLGTTHCSNSNSHNNKNTWHNNSSKTHQRTVFKNNKPKTLATKHI